MNKKMTALAIVMTVCSFPLLAQDPPVIPADTAGLIKQIDQQLGDNPDFLYHWLMSTAKQPRPQGEHDSVELRLAAERLMKRSSGMALKFAVSHWEGLSFRQKEVLDQQQVGFLLKLLENESYLALTEKDWPHELPYRYRFSLPTRILSRCLTDETELIMAKLDHQNPVVRAGAINILSGRVMYRHSVDDARIAKQLIALVDDENMEVRAAAAFAMAHIQSADPNRFVGLLRQLIHDETAGVRWNALYSTRQLAAHVPADHAVALVTQVPTMTTRECQQAVSAIQAIVKAGNESTSNQIVEAGLPLLDTELTNVRSRIVEILAFAAAKCSQPQRDQAVTALALVIAESDDFDEMNSILSLSPLAGKLSAKTRSELVDQLLKVIEAPGATHTVRMGQAAMAATAFVPLMQADAKHDVAKRMLPLLKKPKKRRPALQVIGATGPQGIDAADELTTYVGAKDPWVRLTAARALWQVRPCAETCSEVYVQILRKGPDVARYTARLGLLEMKQDGIVVLDDLIELLQNEDADRDALEVISYLGSAAAEAAEHVKPFLKGHTLPENAAARRALDSF